MKEDTENIPKEYLRLFGEMSYDDARMKIASMKNDKNYENYACYLCDSILNGYTRDYTYYRDRLSDYDKDWRNGYLKAVKLLSKDKNNYYFAVGAFFDNDINDNKKYIKQWLDDKYNKKSEIKLDEIAFVLDVVVIYKNAYPGFYNMLGDMFEDHKVDNEVIELCRFMENYYQCNNNEKMIELLLSFLSTHPKLILPKELMACCYYDIRRWNNALAYFEQIENDMILILPDNFYFMMAYCYGKAKAFTDEEKYYRKSIEFNKYVVYSRNNLGYSFYRQKRYKEALTLFKECFELELDMDIKYAANNYVRTLLAMGHNKEALAFVESGKYKISKAIKERAQKTNGKNYEIPLNNNEQFEVFDEDGEANELSTPNDFIAKSEQFTSEKILEDELTARIESGQSVFGMNLKVWKRKGEYGRQYILPTGKRIDLLCEDEKGDIYIVELKKDSGYDDAYIQTVEYVEWFEKNKRYKGKKIYGIICLNNPKESLINKVHKDPRMRLFEYQISYTER